METTEAATPAALLELAAPEAGTTAKLGRSERLGRSNGGGAIRLNVQTEVARSAERPKRLDLPS
jgi:hypothetical protein|eukprot:COSAG06_NODE_664_length_13285_cov_14.962853_16_plen_64_part_00